MDHITGTDFRFADTCVTFGKFDGLHKGHRRVIDMVARMKERGLSPVLLSFDCNPCGLLGEETVIYTETEKKILLEPSGLRFFISYPFTEETKKTEPELFVKNVLVEKLGAKAVVVGEDFRFGNNLSGDVRLLRRCAVKYGFELVVCKMQKNNGDTITSSLVRKEIAASNPDKAAEILGRAFTMIGEIVHGKALGRTVGLPTANLGFEKNKLIPPHGIYATLTRLDGMVLRGLSIIGLRPTVDNLPYPTVETYLLDFSEDIYGKTLQLEIHARVRDIGKFKDLKEVKKQVQLDIASVREYLNNIK